MNLPEPEALYVALVSDARRLGSLRRLQYRCTSKDRCLLLDAVAVGESVLMHQKRFKQSDVVNQRRSNDEGRAKNTFDGDNHWMPRTFWIGRSALNHPEDERSRLAIQCDHVGVLPNGGEIALTAREFHDDWREQHAEIRVRADGSRYAVE